MRAITCKFGGTSVADAASIRRVVAIVDANPRRRFIVPSAPGKRHAEDQKVTDLLYTWHDDLSCEQTSIVREELAKRFEELAAELSIDLDVRAHLDEIADEVETQGGRDYLVSRGEYLSGLILSRLLNAEFVSPRKHIVLRPDGGVDPLTYTRLSEALAGPGRFVIPGFYGALRDGTVKTFSRGGSDITGAIVARATDSGVYENWTDISGFCMADPRIVPHAGRMAEVTFKELRELAYMGANVFHEEAIFPVQEAGIPIQIRNTWRPEDPGTTILPERDPTELVCGIAGLKGFSTVNIEKTLMNRERGFLQRILDVLDEHDILVEHIATGIDAVSMVVKTKDLEGRRDRLREEIQRKCNPKELSIEDGYSMIATVGQGMQGRVGMAARLCQALARNGISIHIIDQGSPENNVIVGVKESDYEFAVRAIYDEFTVGAVDIPLVKESIAGA